MAHEGLYQAVEDNDDNINDDNDDNEDGSSIIKVWRRLCTSAVRTCVL